MLITDINECASGPCDHGQCVNGDNQFTCNCEAGYTDALCRTGGHWYIYDYIVWILY